MLVLQHDPDDGIKLLAGPMLAQGLLLETHQLSLVAPPASLAGFAGLVVLGATACLSDPEAPSWLSGERGLLDEALSRGLPTLGICFGAQHLAVAAGGSVAPSAKGELGWQELGLTPAANNDPLLATLPQRLHAFQWHYDAIALPQAATLLAEGNGFVQAFRVGPVAWGLQFHLEVDPGAILSWWGSAGHELELAGLGLERLTAECNAYAAANATHVAQVAAGFASIIATTSA